MIRGFYLFIAAASLCEEDFSLFSVCLSYEPLVSINYTQFSAINFIFETASLLIFFGPTFFLFRKINLLLWKCDEIFHRNSCVWDMKDKQNYFLLKLLRKIKSHREMYRWELTETFNTISKTFHETFLLVPRWKPFFSFIKVIKYPWHFNKFFISTRAYSLYVIW
jgi:hypothetical protein